uniref:Uncharacterized protein n=1 Tax=Rhizophora mucronata TaxID=61149 RepID=A0A2P2R2U6_RHIMU
MLPLLAVKAVQKLILLRVLIKIGKNNQQYAF